MSGIKRIKVIDKISPKYEPLLADYHVGGEEIVDPDVIIVRNTEIYPDRFPRNLFAIARAGAGVDNIDMKTATELGIVVFRAPGMNAPSVAEHVFRLLGNHLRPLSESQHFVRSLAGKTREEIDLAIKTNKSKYKGHDLFGRTLGIIGVGHVGQCVTQIALGYGMEVIGYDIKPGHVSGLKWASMEEVLRSADIVTLHVPYIEGVTDNLIGREQIKLMRPDAILVNTARGELVDNTAILERIRDPEAPLSAYLTDLPMPDLIDVEGIVCTPHIGASTDESEDRCAISVARDIDNFIKFGVIRNAANFPTVDKFPRPEIVTRLSIVHRNIKGMIHFMSGVLKAHGVNIEDHETRKANGIAYTIIDLERELPFGVLSEIAKPKKILRVREIRFAK